MLRAFVFFLSTLAPAFATTDTQTCNFAVDTSKSSYTGSEYTPGWGVQQAAKATDADFPPFDDILGSDYFMEMVTMVGIAAGVSIIALYGWCCWCCCRKKCCGKMFEGGPCVCHNNKTAAKGFITITFLLVMVVGLTTFDGQGKIAGSVDTMEDGMTAVGDILGSVVDQTDGLMTQLKNIADSAQQISTGACNFQYVSDAAHPAQVQAEFRNKVDEINSGFLASASGLDGTISSAITSAEDVQGQLRSADDTVSDAMNDVINAMKEYWTAYGSPATTGFALLFVALGFLGFLGVLVPGSYRCSLCLSWNISQLVVIINAVLMVLSIILGDVCSPSPLDNIINLMPSDAGGSSPASTDASASTSDGSESEEGGDFIEFYVGCQGGNPIKPQADDMLNTTRSTLKDSCSLLFEVSADEYEMSSQGFTIKVSKVDPDKCNGAISGIQLGMENSYSILAALIKELLSCQLVNEPLALLLEEGFCNGFADGLYKMWASLFSACFFLIVTMWFVLPAWDAMSPKKVDVAPAPAPAPAPADTAGAAPAKEQTNLTIKSNNMGALPPI